MHLWYYEVDGKQCGPRGMSAIKALLAEGTLTPESHVRNESMGDFWVKVSDVPELSQPEPDPAESARPAEGEEDLCQTLDAPHRFDRLVGFAIEWLEKGVPKKRILWELAEGNVPGEAASGIVREACKIRHAEYRKAGFLHIFTGLGSIIAGVALTLFFSSLLKSLGFGLVFYGLILCGTLGVLNGLRCILFGAANKTVWIPIAVSLVIAAALLTLRHLQVL
jgi:hypothetical protein